MDWVGLDEYSQILQLTRSREDVFEATQRVVNQHFSVARSLVFLESAEGSWRVAAAWTGARPRPALEALRNGHGVLGIALQLGQTMTESRPMGGGGCLFDWERSALMAQGPGLAVYLGAPGPDAFQERDRGYVEILAALAGFAWSALSSPNL